MLTTAYSESVANPNMDSRSVGILIRKAIALPPVSTSSSPPSSTIIANLQDRVSEVALHSLISLSNRHDKIIDPVQSVERVQFYLPYFGADDDRDTQVMIDLMYQYACDPSVYGVKPR